MSSFNQEPLESENDSIVEQILHIVASRSNPHIKLGPVDDSCSFIITDAFARITFVSKTFTKTTGYSFAQVLGKNPRFLQSPGGNVEPGSVRKYSDNNVISHMKASIEGVRECQYSLVNYRKNSEPFINLVTIIPICLYSTSVSHYLGLQIDLVEHPESIVERMSDGNYHVNYSRINGVDYSAVAGDLSSLQSPAKELPLPVFHSQFIDNCGDLVYILSIRGLLLYTSPKSCKDVLGYDAEELQGQHIAELVHPSDLVFVQRELRSASPEQVINLICRFKTKNGGFTTLDLRGHVYQGDTGKRTRCIVLSGREKKTGALFLSDILDPSVDGGEVWAKISPQGLFLFADSGAIDVFGVSSESIYAKSILDFVRGDEKNRVRQALEYASGVVRFFDIVNLPMKTSKGHIIAHIRIYNLFDDTSVTTKHLLLQIKLVVDSNGLNYRISTKTLTEYSQFFINGNILDYQDGPSSIYYEINQLRVENKKLKDRLDDFKKKQNSNNAWSFSTNDNTEIPLIYLNTQVPYSIPDDGSFYGMHFFLSNDAIVFLRGKGDKMNESFLISSHNDFLSMKHLEITSRTISCKLKLLNKGEGYENALLLSEKERVLIKNFEVSQSCNSNTILVFTDLLQKLKKIDTCQKLLFWLNDLLEKFDNFTLVVQEAAGLKIFDILFSLLKNDDVVIQLLAAKISSGLLLYWKGEVDITLLLSWCTDNLRNDNQQIVDLVVQFIQTLLWVQSRKAQIYSSIGLMGLMIETLQKFKSNSQMQYQIIYCIWLLSFEEDIVGLLDRQFNVTPILIDIAQNSIKEKVVRVIASTFKNMLVKAPSVTVVSLLGYNVYSLVEKLLVKKWSDLEIAEDLEFIKEELGKCLANLTTFDVYEAEIKSGNLEWSPPHLSDNFWKTNAPKLNENDHELLKLLTKILLESKDPKVLAVAASDVGQYVKFYSQGKKYLTLVGGKTAVMQLMAHENTDVRYHALLAVQKCMTNAWEF